MKTIFLFHQLPSPATSFVLANFDGKTMRNSIVSDNEVIPFLPRIFFLLQEKVPFYFVFPTFLPVMRLSNVV